MSEPVKHQVVLQPPHPNMTEKEVDFWRKTITERTGGLTSSTVNLKGLKASVPELNTLVGIDTSGGNTVQKQLNDKANLADIGTIAEQDADDVTITGGDITDTDIESSNIKIQSGTTLNYLSIGGTLQVDTVAKSNAPVAVTNLISYTVAGNTLSTTGAYLEITAFGTVAATANVKEVVLLLGSTSLLTTGAVAANSGSWSIKAKIIRTSATTQKCITSIISDNSLIIDNAKYVSGAEDLETDLIIKCTGTSVAAADIVQEGLIIEWHKL